jgi:BatD DUF11 like domain
MLKHFITVCVILLFANAIRAQDIAATMRDNYFLYYGENPAEKIKQNLFCTAIAGRNEVYTGQPIIVTYKLYSAVQSFSEIGNMPSFNGFSVYQVKKLVRQTVEKVNGRYYNCYTIRQVQLYPNEPGTFVLDPAVIKNTVTFMKTDINYQQKPPLPNGYLPGDELPGFEKLNYEYTCKSDQLVIRVLPLPEKGRSNGFSGAVGKFNIEVAASGKVAEKNGILKLVYTLTGAGNFKMINALPVTGNTNFEVFEPVIREALDDTLSPFTGSKIFEYNFSPLREGSLVIPPVSFSYFNAGDQSFHNISTDSVRVQVNPKKEDMLLPVTTSENAATKNTFSFFYLFAAIAVVFLMLFLWYYLKRKKRTQQKKQWLQNENSNAEATEWLPFQQTAQLVHEPVTSHFFEVLKKELDMAVARLLLLPPETGTTTLYETMLQQNCTVSEAYHQLSGELNRLVYARETPGDAAVSYYNRATVIVNSLRGCLKMRLFFI